MKIVITSMVTILITAVTAFAESKPTELSCKILHRENCYYNSFAYGHIYPLEASVIRNSATGKYRLNLSYTFTVKGDEGTFYIPFEDSNSTSVIQDKIDLVWNDYESVHISAQSNSQGQLSGVFTLWQDDRTLTCETVCKDLSQAINSLN